MNNININNGNNKKAKNVKELINGDRNDYINAVASTYIRLPPSNGCSNFTTNLNLTTNINVNMNNKNQYDKNKFNDNNMDDNHYVKINNRNNNNNNYSNIKNNIDFSTQNLNFINSVINNFEYNVLDSNNKLK